MQARWSQTTSRCERPSPRRSHPPSPREPASNRTPAQGSVDGMAPRRRPSAEPTVFPVKHGHRTSTSAAPTDIPPLSTRRPEEAASRADNEGSAICSGPHGLLRFHGKHDYPAVPGSARRGEVRSRHWGVRHAESSAALSSKLGAFHGKRHRRYSPRLRGLSARARARGRSRTVHEEAGFRSLAREERRIA